MCTENLKSNHPDLARSASAADDVAEVIATYQGRMVDVAHLGREGRAPARKRAGILAGLGLAAMAGGLGLFAYESAQPWDTWEAASLEAAESGMTAPAKPGLGTGGLGLGLALMGLVPALMGLTRLREDEDSAYGIDTYVIGESPTARMTVDGAGLPEGGHFPLVQRDADGVQINFGADMRGAVTLAGREHTFASLVETGAARAHEGHYRLTLPRGARGVVEHGGLRFWVRAVDPSTLDIERAPMDGAFWGYIGGAGAIAAATIFMINSIPDSMLAINYDDEASDARYARYLLLAEPEPEPEPAEVIEDHAPAGEASRDNAGARAPGQTGEMGKPDEPNTGKRFAMRKVSDIPQLGRNRDLSGDARQAGVLGVMAQMDPSMFATPYGGAFHSGADDRDMWGNFMGREVGMSGGVGGLGPVGVGPGGGGTATGVIGLSTAGVLEQRGIGDGESLVKHRGSSTKLDDRTPKGPRVHVKSPITKGDIDKQMIRRTVRAHINEVRACYNAGLSRNPHLQGRVEVSFVIMGNGSVGTSVVSSNGLKDRQTSQCIAGAVKRWKFARRGGGGAVTVKYPFSLTNG